MLGFDRPLFILAAFLLVPGLFFVSRWLKSLFALDLPLGPPGGIAFKSPVNMKLLMKFLHFFELAGVFLLMVAASGPHLVLSETVWLNRGADIFFVIDISPSMAGMDMNGRSRFDAARVLVGDFADRRPQDSIGIIAMGEDAALLLPLTTDRATLHSRLESLSIGELGDGTAIGTGLALAAFHINKSQEPRRVVALITDGENNAGVIHPETAAAMLGEIGTSLWVIGVGSSGEIPINYVDPFTRMRRTGTFESRYDPEVLKRIADRAGGHWIQAPHADQFTAAFAYLDEGEMVIRRSGVTRKEEPLYGLFIIMALGLIWGARVVRCHILGALI